MTTQLTDAPHTIPFTDQVNGVGTLDGSALDGKVARRLMRGERVSIPLNKLKSHPDNTRLEIGDLTELTRSVARLGVLQALTVVPGKPAGYYYVVIGNRRRQAAIDAGMTEVDCTIRQDMIGLRRLIPTMLHENANHNDISPLEKGMALARLRHEEGMSLREISLAVGWTDATISSYLALLELSPEMQGKLARKEITMAEALTVVRAARARIRKAMGQGDQRKAMAQSWEPDHFDRTHILASRASRLCDARGHTQRRRLGKGKVACGECFETLIREDEEPVVASKIMMDIENAFDPSDPVVTAVLDLLQGRVSKKRKTEARARAGIESEYAAAS